MKHKAISQSIFILLFALVFIFTLSSFVYASEVTGNLSSIGVNTTSTNTTGSISGSVTNISGSADGSIGGTVGSGSQVSGTVGNASISGSVTGGSNSGGGGNNSFLALATTSESAGSVLGASTFSGNGNSLSPDGMSLQNNSSGEVYDTTTKDIELAIAGDFIPEAQVQTFDQTASVINTDAGRKLNPWLWIIFLLLVLIAIAMYIYSGSREKKNFRIN